MSRSNESNEIFTLYLFVVGCGIVLTLGTGVNNIYNKYKTEKALEQRIDALLQKPHRTESDKIRLAEYQRHLKTLQRTI